MLHRARLWMSAVSTQVKYSIPWWLSYSQFHRTRSARTKETTWILLCAVWRLEQVFCLYVHVRSFSGSWAICCGDNRATACCEHVLGVSGHWCRLFYHHTMSEDQQSSLFGRWLCSLSLVLSTAARKFAFTSYIVNDDVAITEVTHHDTFIWLLSLLDSFLYIVIVCYYFII